jgi:hypothetical protein
MEAYVDNKPAFVLLSSSLDEIKTFGDPRYTDPFDLENTLIDFEYSFGNGKYQATFTLINPSEQAEKQLLSLYNLIYAKDEPNITISNPSIGNIKFYFSWGYTTESMSTPRAGILGSVNYSLTASNERVISFTLLDSISFNEIQDDKRPGPIQIVVKKGLYKESGTDTLPDTPLDFPESASVDILRPSEVIPVLLKDFLAQYRGDVFPYIKGDSVMKKLDAIYDALVIRLTEQELQGNGILVGLEGGVSLTPYKQQAWEILGRSLGMPVTINTKTISTGNKNTDVKINDDGNTLGELDPRINLYETFTSNDDFILNEGSRVYSALDGSKHVCLLSDVYEAISQNTEVPNIFSIPIKTGRGFETDTGFTVGDLFAGTLENFALLATGRYVFLPGGFKENCNIGNLTTSKNTAPPSGIGLETTDRFFNTKGSGLDNPNIVLKNYDRDYLLIGAIIERALQGIPSTTPSNDDSNQEAGQEEVRKQAYIQLSKTSTLDYRLVLDGLISKINEVILTAAQEKDELLTVESIPVSELSNDEKNKVLSQLQKQDIQDDKHLFVIGSDKELDDLFRESSGDENTVELGEINSFPQLYDGVPEIQGVELGTNGVLKLTVGFDDSIVSDMSINSDIKIPIVMAGSMIQSLQDIRNVFTDSGLVRDDLIDVLFDLDERSLASAAQEFNRSQLSFAGVYQASLKQFLETAKLFIASNKKISDSGVIPGGAKSIAENVERMLTAVESESVRNLLFSSVPEEDSSEVAFEFDSGIIKSKKIPRTSISFKPSIFNQEKGGIGYFLKKRSLLDEVYLNYILNVSIKTLGIPEISSSFKDIRFRRVLLFVSNPRGSIDDDGVERKYHWSSGVYRILGYTHQANSTDGYTTSFELQRDVLASVEFTAFK